MSFPKRYFLLILFILGYCMPAALRAQTTAYSEQDLSFRSKGNKLWGKLILPEHYKGKLPVVVFVHGSGPEDYSSSDNYRYLWETFTRIGFACYSWDRPGVDKSEGQWYTCSVADRAQEVLDAVQQLKATAAIDTAQIGFWGISQAGWVLPMVAQYYKPSFVITVSSPVTTAFEQELYRVQSEMKAEGFATTDISKALAYNHSLQAMIQAGQPYDSFAVLQKAIEDAKWKDNVISGDAMVYDYLRIVFKADSAPDLRGLHCPLLAIWGANDLVVPPLKSAAAYKKAMLAMGNRKAVIKIIPGADHTLTYNKTGKRAETLARREQYKDDPKEIFAPGYVKLMADWLQGLW